MYPGKGIRYVQSDSQVKTILKVHNGSYIGDRSYIKEEVRNLRFEMLLLGSEIKERIKETKDEKKAKKVEAKAKSHKSLKAKGTCQRVLDPRAPRLWW
ncbi:hypothetical protein EV1_041524 [Malus domestica]